MIELLTAKVERDVSESDPPIWLLIMIISLCEALNSPPCTLVDEACERKDAELVLCTRGAALVSSSVEMDLVLRLLYELVLCSRGAALVSSTVEVNLVLRLFNFIST